AADPDGSIWARLRGPALLRYRHRQFEDMLARVGQSVVTAMIRGHDGAILMATLGQGAVAYRRGVFEPIASPTLMPHSFAISIAETSAGAIWLGPRERAAGCPSLAHLDRRGERRRDLARDARCRSDQDRRFHRHPGYRGAARS